MSNTVSGRMIYPFSTGHQACCSSRKRSSHVSLSSISFAISFVSMAWNTEHRAFVVETYFKCGDSVIAAQRQFCTHFWLRPARKSVKQKNHIVVDTQFLTDLFSIKTEISWQILQRTDTRNHHNSETCCHHITTFRCLTCTRLGGI